MVFYSSMSDHSPVPDCVLHSAFSSLSWVSQKGLGFAVETNNSEISLDNMKVFPHILCGRALFLLHNHIEAPAVLCPLAAIGKKETRELCMSQPRSDTCHCRSPFIGQNWSHGHSKSGKWTWKGAGRRSGEYRSLSLPSAQLTACHLPSLLFHHRRKRHHLGSAR